MGRFEEARVALYRALALRPDHALASRSLGQVLYRLGRTDEARRVFRQWLEHDPDNPIARHLFAACGGNAPPERASDAYVESLFDGAAPGYDASLRDLDYRVPELIASLLAERVGKPRASLEVLDAGCGTGLCGPTLRPYASRLAGVDLSAAMLERAGELGLYDELIRAELTAHLRQREAAYDLVVAADTLVYFGELRTILAAAAASLRPGGSLAFSVERTDEESDCGYRLATHGRYSHLRSYLEREISRSGLSLREILTDVLRTEVGQPVRGWIVLARKDAGAGAAG
jgi:predicted TPR repeat methyltransferase